MKQFFYRAGAGLFFLLALLGIILPGLPTTPFLLLTSYLLVRTSPKLNDRLLQSRTFGPLLRDWQQRGGIRRHVKLQALGTVVIVIGITLYFADNPAWLRPVILVAAAIGITVVMRLPEVR